MDDDNVLSRSVVSDSVRPCGLEPTSLLCPWDFPGKNIGVDCHSFLQGIFQSRDWTGISYTLPVLASRFFTTDDNDN